MRAMQSVIHRETAWTRFPRGQTRTDLRNENPVAPGDVREARAFPDYHPAYDAADNMRTVVTDFAELFRSNILLEEYTKTEAGKIQSKHRPRLFRVQNRSAVSSEFNDDVVAA